jgi:DNA polymerase
MGTPERQALTAALQWQVESGVDEAMEDTPRALRPKPAPAAETARTIPAVPDFESGDMPEAAERPVLDLPPLSSFQPGGDLLLQGTADMRAEALRLAQAANTLEELRAAVAGFEGLAIRKTATNMVFCDGNPAAPVMLVGEAPGADEDRQGKPFVGVSGQLLDRIFALIGLDRKDEDPLSSLYISNILNWRPPGNRTPTPAEVEISLPFIERHIALARPKILILAGGVSAKALLDTTAGISRLRGKFQLYKPLTPGITLDSPIPVMATYHPAYLLRTPSQKRAVWQDVLMIQEKRRELGILPLANGS